MGLLGSLMMLLSMWLFCSLTVVSLQSSTTSISDAQALDALLQDYAYQAFVRPRTGVVYDGVVPSNLTGIQVSAMRLRKFAIPVGVLEQPYVERLVLVYQNLGNWSMTYYPLQGYMYLAPVLGLLAYDASDLMAKNLPELDIKASGQPISIKFSKLRTVPDGSVPKCVIFDLSGSVNFSNVLSDNICTTFQQGHFSIVVESIAPSPIPVSPIPMTPPQPGGAPSQGPMRDLHCWLCWDFCSLGVQVQAQEEMHQMERAAEIGEALHMTTVGSTKAPAATGTRTQPTLETEYVP
ncbi:hypothetical protein Pfo_028046 [Paulownia fortunei]|nr:hypothetical protein Pfo_028046 [Paulownia fortunei]